MGAESGQSQDTVFDFSVDEQKVPLNVTLAISAPVSAQLMIAMSLIKRQVICKRG